MGPIQNIGVMDDAHPTREKLDNLANVRFRRDALFPASRQNRTLAGLSKSSYIQYTLLNMLLF